MTEKYGSNIDIERYKNELRTTDLKTESIALGINVVESLVDTKIGTSIIDQLRTSFTVGKISASSIGPATTLEVAADTTPGSTIALKGVSKVLGGGVSLGQTTYDVYVDYETFGSSENFAKAATADIGKTVALTFVGGVAVSYGAPVYAVALGGGYLAYLVDKKLVDPWKKELK